MSSSDDGRVSIWDWKTGTLVSSFMRHSSSVRSFFSSPIKEEQVLCAQADGAVVAWDTKHQVKIDITEPDPKWLELFRFNYTGCDQSRKKV